jgi:hypothetical protein
MNVSSSVLIFFKMYREKNDLTSLPFKIINIKLSSDLDDSFFIP